MSALLFVATVLLFSRAVPFGFVNYDDPAYVTDNPHVQGGLTWAGVVWAFTGAADYWHPLTWLSHMLDWQVWGANATGHHLTSVLWHAVNAVLVFLVFRRLAGGLGLSAFAAALFAWHPLRVESVVWITERKDVMSGCFFLLTLLAYMACVRRRGAGRSWLGPYLAAVGCFVLGLMSKPMIVTVPLVLLVLDFWPLARRSSPGGLRLAVIEKIPFFALSGVVAVITVLMQRQHGAFVLDLSVGDRLANAVVSIGRYGGKFLWPFDLVVCYPHPGSWPVGVVLVSTAFFAGVSWIAWWQRTSRPWIAVGWMWFLVVLLPVIGLVQVGFQAMADRYTYLAMLGVELAVFWSLPSIPGFGASRARLGVACGAAVILGALAARTWDQQAEWRDSIALFEHAVACSAPNDVAEDFLSSALFAAGRLEEAGNHAERACALNPRNGTARTSLASVRERQGRVGEAREHYRAATELLPGRQDIRCQLGLLELHAGRTEEARRLMLPALGAAPELRGRLLDHGEGALGRRDLSTARFVFELVLAVDANDARAHAGLAQILFASNDPAGAIEHLEAAVRADPDRADLQLMLARGALQAGRTQMARAALEHALEAAPNDAAVLASAAELYARQREFARATSLYRRAVALAPDDPGMHAALGYVLVLNGDRAAGLAAWRRALDLDPAFPGLRERLADAERHP